jgi:hypothetical protein
MTDDLLKLYLPWVVALFMLVAFWRSVEFVITYEPFLCRKYKLYHHLKKVRNQLTFILVLFRIMTITYAYLPTYYRFFLPIDRLNHPLINSVGFMALKISFAWAVVSQILFEREILKYGTEKDVNPRLIYYAEVRLLKGTLLMFVSMVVTISNVIGILLLFVALLIYLHMEQQTKVRI